MDVDREGRILASIRATTQDVAAEATATPSPISDNRVLVVLSRQGNKVGGLLVLAAQQRVEYFVDKFPRQLSAQTVL